MTEGELYARIDAGFARVHERLDEVVTDNSEQHTEIKEQLATIGAECGPCREDVAQHEKDLRGSNGDGLRTRVKVLEERQKELGNPARRATVAQRTSVASVVTAVVAAIWAILASMFGK